MSEGCVNTAADIFVHKSLTACASMTVGWILMYDIAGPKGIYVRVSLFWFRQLGTKNGGLSCHSLLTRWAERTVFLTGSLALGESVIYSSTGKKIHVYSFKFIEAEHLLVCLSANSISCVTVS